MEFYKQALKSLSLDSLLNFIKDCEMRIGSHIAESDELIPEYVERQQNLIDLAREEYKRRIKIV